MVVSLNISAQLNNSERDFEKIFDREMIADEQDTQTSPILFSIGAEKLPKWFWDIPASSSHEIYAIGISDPNFNSPEGKKQAYERAILQFGLMRGTYISGLSDSYFENLNNKYEEIYRCKNMKNVSGTLSVIDSFDTRFGEKVLLVKLNTNNMDTLNSNLIVEKYKSITRAESGWFTCEKISTIYTRDSISLDYQYSQNNDNFSLNSIFNKQKITIPLGIFDYELPPNQVQPADTLRNKEFIKLSHKGLWYGYFQSFINSMFILSENLRSSVKNLGQVKLIENENLTRNVSQNFVRFYIKKIEAIDDNFTIELTKSL